MSFNTNVKKTYDKEIFIQRGFYTSPLMVRCIDPTSQLAALLSHFEMGIQDYLLIKDKNYLLRRYFYNICSKLIGFFKAIEKFTYVIFSNKRRIAYVQQD